MANPEDAAKEFLKGLGKRDAPWDTGGYKMQPRAAAKPAAKPAPRSTADDAMDQAERIARRNREVAKKTRYLRQN